MLQTDTIELREIRLPLREPFVTSSGTQDVRRILLLELRTRDGLSAWSECVAQETPDYSPETIDTAWFAIREWAAPLLRRGGPASPDVLLTHLERHIRGHRMAKAALEMAFWSLQAQCEQVSLAALLGGTRSRVPVGISIGIQSEPSVLVDRVRACVDEGYRKIKMKIRPGADVPYVAAVRDALGGNVPLAVDANTAYTLDDIETLRSLDRFELLMIEQPLEHDDLLRHAELQRQVATPICLDESISSPRRAVDMVRLESGRIVNVKPGRVGGLGPAVRIHDICRDHGLGAWVGGMLESGIGRAYNVALASLPHFSIPGDLSPSSRYWARDIVTPEWAMTEDGFVEVPFDRVGLGVSIDRDRIEDLTHRRETVLL